MKNPNCLDLPVEEKNVINRYAIAASGTGAYVDEASPCFPSKILWTDDVEHAMRFPYAFTASMWAFSNVFDCRIIVLAVA